MESRWRKHFQRRCSSGSKDLKSARPKESVFPRTGLRPWCEVSGGDPLTSRIGPSIPANAVKLWTASALAVALVPGLGCQDRHAGRDAKFIVAHNHVETSGRVMPASAPLWHATPTTHVFRGSASAVSVPNDTAIP